MKGLRLGLPKEYFIGGIDPQVEAAVRAAVDHYAKLGAEIVEVSLPHTEYAVAVYYIIATAEASANLARFDGVRYGHRAKDTSGLLDFYGKTREEGFGAEVKRRIILGTYVLSQRVLRRVLSPRAKGAHADPARFPAGVRDGGRADLPDLARAGVQDRRAHAEPAGDVSAGYFHHRREPRRHLRREPAVRVRAAEDGRELPIGLQLLGPSFDEARLLQIAHAYEQSTDWHKRRPPLAADQWRRFAADTPHTYYRDDTDEKAMIAEHISLTADLARRIEQDNEYARGIGMALDGAVPNRQGATALSEAYGKGFDLLLGRRTYDLWAGFWPMVRGGPFAEGINAATKHVATHRPESLAWGPVEHLGSDMMDGVRRLKAQDGPDLMVCGISSLTAAIAPRGSSLTRWCWWSTRSCWAGANASWRTAPTRATSLSPGRRPCLPACSSTPTGTSARGRPNDFGVAVLASALVLHAAP